MLGDGIPGCNAPIGFIDALTFLRSVRRCYLLDFFFITKIGEIQEDQVPQYVSILIVCLLVVYQPVVSLS